MVSKFLSTSLAFITLNVEDFNADNLFDQVSLHGEVPKLVLAVLAAVVGHFIDPLFREAVLPFIKKKLGVETENKTP